MKRGLVLTTRKIGIDEGVIFIKTKVISRHLGWVRSIAFDPSNTWFCTGSTDRTIKVVGGLVIVIMLPLVALTTQTASYVFTHFETAPESTGISNEVYVVILSFLTNQHSLHGYDAAAHLTEETKGADKNGLVVILSSIGIISVFGWAYILALTFSIQAFFSANAAAQASRKFSPGVTNEAVQNDAAVLKGSNHRHGISRAHAPLLEKGCTRDWTGFQTTLLNKVGQSQVRQLYLLLLQLTRVHQRSTPWQVAWEFKFCNNQHRRGLGCFAFSTLQLI